MEYAEDIQPSVGWGERGWGYCETTKTIETEVYLLVQ